MRNESTNILIKQIYRQSLRRIFLINLANNIILFSIFGIFVFDFSMIIYSTSPNLSSNLLIILSLMIPVLAIYKTIKDLPSIYFILATIDHKAATRGIFSLLNEISKKEPENKSLELLLSKSEPLIKSLDMKKIFPWKLLWNGYFGAALTFTIILWIAIPPYKKSENISLLTEQKPSSNDFSIKKDDPMINAFKNNAPTPKNSESNTAALPEKKPTNQKNAKETSKDGVELVLDQNNQEIKSNDKRNEPEDAQKNPSIKKDGGKGSGSEEAKTDQTTEIKKNTSTETTNTQKINLVETSKQDGSSVRMGTKGNSKNDLTEEKLNTTTNIKMQKINNLSGMVSSKYQKIIENYFSEE